MLPPEGSFRLERAFVSVAIVAVVAACLASPDAKLRAAAASAALAITETSSPAGSHSAAGESCTGGSCACSVGGSGVCDGAADGAAVVVTAGDEA